MAERSVSLEAEIFSLALTAVDPGEETLDVAAAGRRSRPDRQVFDYLDSSSLLPFIGAGAG